jgi:2-oxoglutarate ferredoxin oxidoreductase subunit alpha
LENTIRKRYARHYSICCNRVGGLEKEDITGNISYEPENHEKMCFLRAEKVERVADFISKQEVYGDESGDLLVIGWGGTYGSLYTAVKELREEGKKVSLAHFNYINPLPKNTAEIFKNFKNIVVCELNNGQFVDLLKSKHDTFQFKQFNHIQGLPFKTTDLKEHFNTLIS